MVFHMLFHKYGDHIYECLAPFSHVCSYTSMKFHMLFQKYGIHLYEKFAPFSELCFLTLFNSLFVLRYADLERRIWEYTREGMGLPLWRKEPGARGFERSWLYKYLRTMMEFPETAQYMYDALKQSHYIGVDKWTVAYVMELQVMRADRDMNVDLRDASVYGVMEEVAEHDLKERRDKLRAHTTFHY